MEPYNDKCVQNRLIFRLKNTKILSTLDRFLSVNIYEGEVLTLLCKSTNLEVGQRKQSFNI